jgi:hypothetical protein
VKWTLLDVICINVYTEPNRQESVLELFIVEHSMRMAGNARQLWDVGVVNVS